MYKFLSGRGGEGGVCSSLSMHFAFFLALPCPARSKPGTICDGQWAMDRVEASALARPLAAAC